MDIVYGGVQQALSLMGSGMNMDIPPEPTATRLARVTTRLDKWGLTWHFDGIETAVKDHPHGPGRSYRTGILLIELAEMFPTEEAAVSWFEMVGRRITYQRLVA